LVRQDDALALEMVERELNIEIGRPFIGLVIERYGKSVGALVLNEYRPPRNIEVTAIANGPWTASDLRGVLRYCFDRVDRITCRTRTTNFQAIKRLQMMGFRHEGVMRRYFGAHDAAIYGLLKGEQRMRL